MTTIQTVHPSADVRKQFSTHEAWLQFVKETAGSWEGETLERPAQGEFEQREEWGCDALVTQNVREFGRVSGLKMEDWETTP